MTDLMKHPREKIEEKTQNKTKSIERNQTQKATENKGIKNIERNPQTSIREDKDTTQKSKKVII